MPQWRRTHYTLWVTQFIAVAGFSFVTPFVPYYIQELGVTDLAQVGLWAALVTAGQAVSMALVASTAPKERSVRPAEASIPSHEFNVHCLRGVNMSHLPV